MSWSWMNFLNCSSYWMTKTNWKKNWNSPNCSSSSLKTSWMKNLKNCWMMKNWMNLILKTMNCYWKKNFQNCSNCSRN